jgi:hypothetical protein
MQVCFFTKKAILGKKKIAGFAGKVKNGLSVHYATLRLRRPFFIR